MTTARTGRKELQRIAAALSERDWSILRFIDQHRYATTTQLRRRFFTHHTSQTASTRACVRVLGRLFTHRILTRLERRIGGVRHGSSAFIWCLEVVGDRLLRSKGASRRRVHEPSFPFLDHTLAVTETHVQLYEAEVKGIFRVNDVQVETEAWRSFVTSSGAKSVLKPDLKVTIASDEYDDHWYLEVDRGTESLPILIRKSKAYEDYRRTGRGQAEHGVFPRVLWVLPDSARVGRLRAAIDGEPGLPSKMFTCTTSDELILTLCSPP
jgi:hypothetical protein